MDDLFHDFGSDMGAAAADMEHDGIDISDTFYRDNIGDWYCVRYPGSIKPEIVWFPGATFSPDVEVSGPYMTYSQALYDCNLYHCERSIPHPSTIPSASCKLVTDDSVPERDRILGLQNCLRTCVGYDGSTDYSYEHPFEQVDPRGYDPTTQTFWRPTSLTTKELVLNPSFSEVMDYHEVGRALDPSTRGAGMAVPSRALGVPVAMPPAFMDPRANPDGAARAMQQQIDDAINYTVPAQYQRIERRIDREIAREWARHRAHVDLEDTLGDLGFERPETTPLIEYYSPARPGELQQIYSIPPSVWTHLPSQSYLTSQGTDLRQYLVDRAGMDMNEAHPRGWWAGMRQQILDNDFAAWLQQHAYDDVWVPFTRDQRDNDDAEDIFRFAANILETNRGRFPY